MTSPVLQPATMKRRFQSVVRRSLSKLRHEPPPVPPKDDQSASASTSIHARSLSQPTTSSIHQQERTQNPSRPQQPAIPPHYYHNYTQTDCDGRHYEPSSPTSPTQPTSSYDYDASKGQRYYGHDEATQYDLTPPSPNVNEMGPTTTGRLSLNTKDHGSPLIPRQELMVLGNPPPIVPAITTTTTTTEDSAIGLARSSSSSKGQEDEEGQQGEGFIAGPVYIPSPPPKALREEVVKQQEVPQEVEGFKAGPVYGQGYGQGTQSYSMPSVSELDRVMEEEDGEGASKNSEFRLRPAPKPPQQDERPLYELKRKEVPMHMMKGVGQDQWERREGEHTWDFGEVHAALDDDDRRGEVGRAISKDERVHERSTSFSKKDSEDEPAYHHVAVPAEESRREKGTEEYTFPRTVPEDTVDQAVENAPAVVHETVQPEVHEVVQQQVHRDIHHYEEHYRIQPVVDVEILPTRHIFIDAQGNASELHFEGGKPPPGFNFDKPF